MRQYFYLPLFAFIGLSAVSAPVMAAPLDVAPQQTLAVSVADDASLEGAKKFIDSMAQRGIGFLGNETLTQEQRTAEFRTLLNSSFDMATIGRFALGRYWKSATPAQQTEYQKLFKSMIVSVYSRRFSDYKGEKMDVGGAIADQNGDVLVSSSIVPPNGQKVQVDWRVRAKGGGYKVVDIIVEGVSMALTQRSDFSSVIQSGGGDVEVLLQHLRQQ